MSKVYQICISTFLVADGPIVTLALVPALLAPGAGRTGLLGVTDRPGPARLTGAGEGGGAGAVSPLARPATPATAYGLTTNLLGIIGPGPALATAGLTDHLGHVLHPEDRHQLPLDHLPLEWVGPAEAEHTVLQLSDRHHGQGARVDGNNKQFFFIADTRTADIMR